MKRNLTVDNQLFACALSIIKGSIQDPPHFSVEEWHKFLEDFKSCGLCPLLYFKVRSIDNSFGVPDEILSFLKNSFMSASINALRMENQVKQILAEFKRASIPALFLKGFAFGRYLYPDPAARPCGDIDLLILPQNVHRAEAILKELNYACHKEQFNKLKELEVENTFTPKAGNRFAIDLHWRLHGFFGVVDEISVARCFERAVEVKSPGINFKTLDPVDALIYAAVHSLVLHNQSFSLLWLYDIYLLANLLDDQGWERLKEESFKLKANLVVVNALELARQWFGLTLPESFYLWPRPTNQERRTWQAAITRQDSLLKWFRVRWPRALGIKGNARLAFKLFQDQLNRRFARVSFGTKKVL